MQLLNGYVITVHKEVQEVNSKMPGSRTEPEAITHNGNQVCKISSQI